MLCLTRKTDYALIALGFLAERQASVVSAREIAAGHRLPLALLMNILKALQKNGIVRSARGVRGGYVLGARLNEVSLHELICVLEGKVEPGCDHEDGGDVPKTVIRGADHPTIQALHYKLMQFLHDVSLADLVLPGRRIDIPAEMLRNRRARKSQTSVAREMVSAEQ